MRFNRALYGSNTAFRVETGDLPEFAMYLPGMGGNLQFGWLRGGNSKWLIKAKQIKAIYRPGSMLYEISDGQLGNGSVAIQVLPLYTGEGMLVKLSYTNVPVDGSLCWAYGGVTGKKFSRDGDIGADLESSFYLQPAYCKDNRYNVNGNRFELTYGAGKAMEGIFPEEAVVNVADAAALQTPAGFIKEKEGAAPVISGLVHCKQGSGTLYFFIGPKGSGITSYAGIKEALEQAETARRTLAQRVVVKTPDVYINTLGGALGLAADGIWESPTYLHGAVAWRMRLNAWRGAYIADPLGWHDRARTHFDSYALSQVTMPETGPVVADTALHLARQLEKMGTSLFSSGYICRNPNGDIRPHHYDMNLVFIDQLMRHFGWTGDTAYVKQIWPVIQRHLAWEKRNFDSDNDGLYDAYCCIWASDALQYSGGSVTHSTAYNYFANRMAAQLAVLIGEDGSVYEKEADKIYNALQHTLWMPGKGWYAEYKDALGQQLLHPAAGLWTIYHAIDSRVPDMFQAYQSLRYIDNYIPHIPVTIAGEPDNHAYALVSTTNWQPYTWSLNNVALAENLHTSLAYWQGNRADDAYKLWKSALVESMYMSASPGGFQQLSYYDAVRGELYRDFADPIGMAGRTLVEGLFGIVPDALHDTLTIHPGFPAEWKEAALSVPDIQFSYQQTGLISRYSITPSFRKRLHLRLQLNAVAAGVESVTVNGKAMQWRNIVAVGGPAVEITVPAAAAYAVVVQWKEGLLDVPSDNRQVVRLQEVSWSTKQAVVTDIYDPQQVLKISDRQKNRLQAVVTGEAGEHTFFLLLKQGDMQWWCPVNVLIQQPVSVVAAPAQRKGDLLLQLSGRAQQPMEITLTVNAGSKAYTQAVSLPGGNGIVSVTVPAERLITGSNRVQVSGRNGILLDTVVASWETPLHQRSEPVPLSTYFNDKVVNIFSHQYLQPRPATPTLQLPVQGIGNWCYPLAQTAIDDEGLRNAAAGGTYRLPQGIAFATPADGALPNILFTSQWNNFPEKAAVPLTGKASHIYLLMAGSTNAMQSQLVNGKVVVKYKDGSTAVLELRNPDTWCPIEQDYDEDGLAFHLDKPRMPRVYLKTGEVATTLPSYSVIKGYSNRAVDGGAATVLDLPLDNNKELDSLTIQTIANDVVIGLMAASLVR